jgi:glycosyltransferase involved in cell wall biosynthesis
MLSDPKPYQSGNRRVLLISNRVMHYRVSVYNYFSERFRQHGWEFMVLTNELQRENKTECQFQLLERPFGFLTYRAEINRIRPQVIILFLHLKDVVLWPLIHWLKMSGIPVAVWTKGRNLDDPDNRWRNVLFDYIHWQADALILYTSSIRRFISARATTKAFVANNTINYESFPTIVESKEDIKRDLDVPFRKVVLFVGRIGEERNRKKVDHLIEMFRHVHNPEYGLVIVGSGLTNELRSSMNSENTRYLGEVHDPEHRQISRIFKMADICCIPGHVGLGLNQAMFWGLPTVTEEGNQPPEIEYLQNGKNGFIVPENDRLALRNCVLRLLDDDELRRELSRNARRDLFEKASIEGMFQGFFSCVMHLQGQARYWLVPTALANHAEQ